MLSATLGKIAQNVYNLQVTDVDELSEFVEGKIGSSAMPHKLNPVASGSVVLLGRLLRARAPLALDYVHAEWEDDHRQGETRGASRTRSACCSARSSRSARACSAA